MQTEDQKVGVYQAIAAVQRDLAKEGIAKSQVNQMQRYRFRGIDDVYNTLAPLLAKHGLCILPRITDHQVIERESKKGEPLYYVTVSADFDFVASSDGSKHTVSTYGEAMDTSDKATNKAMSAAYKYAAFMAFAIPTEGDNDSETMTHEVSNCAASSSAPVQAKDISTESQEQNYGMLVERIHKIQETAACDRAVNYVMQCRSRGELTAEQSKKLVELLGSKKKVLEGSQHAAA